MCNRKLLTKIGNSKLLLKINYENIQSFVINDKNNCIFY